MTDDFLLTFFKKSIVTDISKYTKAYVGCKFLENNPNVLMTSTETTETICNDIKSKIACYKKMKINYVLFDNEISYFLNHSLCFIYTTLGSSIPVILFIDDYSEIVYEYANHSDKFRIISIISNMVTNDNFLKVASNVMEIAPVTLRRYGTTFSNIPNNNDDNFEHTTSMMLIAPMKDSLDFKLTYTQFEYIPNPYTNYYEYYAGRFESAIFKCIKHKIFLKYKEQIIYSTELFPEDIEDKKLLELLLDSSSYENEIQFKMFLIDLIKRKEIESEERDMIEKMANKKCMFGGAFNPPTKTHIQIIEMLSNLFSEVYVVPNDLKHYKQDAVKFKYRYKMLQMCINKLDHNENIIISDTEHTGNYYGSYDTLRALDHPVFVCGDDFFENVVSWHDPEILLEENEFLVLTRNKTIKECKIIINNDPMFSKYKDHFNFIQLNFGRDVSSSKYRETHDKTLLPANCGIENYIKRRKLYEEK